MTLKHALETLLGAPCHHMAEVFGRTETDPPAFLAATKGDLPDWEALLGGYAAAVDWPASAFYAELAEAYPDAVVVLSRRDSFETWWKSANNTIFQAFEAESRGAAFGGADWPAMIDGLWTKTFGDADRADPAAVKAAYDRYHERVRATVPAGRLVEFETGAGWEPLCAALDLPIPETPFPHLNTTADFNSQNLDEMSPQADRS